MKKKIILSAAIASFFNFSAMASEYSYNDETFKVDIGKSNISVNHCDKEKKCDEASANINDLKKTLRKRISEYEDLLGDKKGLLSEVKKQVESTKDIIKDEKGEALYVMVNLGENFNLPILEKKAKAGEFDLVFSAIEANISRYKRVLDVLDAGKEPKGFSSTDYGKIAPIMEMHNIVKFAKHL
jgi:predicted transcriptional regulator